MPAIPVNLVQTPKINFATGTVTYTWPRVPAGAEQNVSAVVPSSPVGVAWSVAVNGTPVGGMVGNGPFGEFYVGQNAEVTVTGTSLLLFSNAITTLSGNPLYAPGPAVLEGAQAGLGQLGPVSPTQGGGYPAGLTLVSSSASVGVSSTPVINLSGGARGVLVVAEAVPSLVSAFNQELGPPIPVSYGALELNAGGPTGLPGFWFLPNFSSLEVQFNFSASTIYFAYEVDTDFDYPALAATLPVYNVQLANPAAGADWSWTVPGACRLVAAQAQLTTSSTPASRFTYLWVAGGLIAQIPMSPTLQAASTTLIMSGFPGAGVPFQRPSDNRCTFAIPAGGFLLPAGSVVESATASIQSGDTWQNVQLTFAAA